MKPATSLRVLIAEDLPDLAETLAFMLRSAGYSVELAFDGVAAVGLARAFQPDVILLDIGMPRLDGFEAAWWIRKQLGSKVVLIALTCWGRDEDRERARLAGFDDIFIKPVDLDVLLQRLAELGRAPTDQEMKSEDSDSVAKVTLVA